MNRKNLAMLMFGLLFVAFGWYASRFIEKTSFLIEGERYYVLFDDAMISMQYAKTLADGHGLVWYPGAERVEGFSNPLWVFLMAAFHLLPLTSAQMGLPVQISAAIFLIINLIFVRKLALLVTDNEWIALGAAFLTAFFFSLNNWSMQGMEVSLATLLVTVTAFLMLSALQQGKFSWGAYLLLGVGTLLRIDMIVPYLAFTGLMFLFDSENRRRHLLVGLSVLIVFLAVQTAARYAYYGEWLPNTYYLKVGGITTLARVMKGVENFVQFIWTTGWFLYTIPLAIFFLRPKKSTTILFLVVMGQVAYSVYVGGDAWEHRGGANRFISVAMPLFFVLYVYALELIRQALFAARDERFPFAKVFSVIALAGIVVGSLFSFNTILTNDSLLKWTLVKRPIFVSGTERAVRMGLAIKSFTTPDASVMMATAGSISYFSERPGIDLYGKMDKVIARTPQRTDTAFRPGHNKWDYDHSIATLLPDVIAQFADDSMDEAQPYLDEYGYERVKLKDFIFYIREDSSYILWDVVK